MLTQDLVQGKFEGLLNRAKRRPSCLRLDKMQLRAKSHGCVSEPPAKMFISQGTLEAWMDDSAVEVGSESLTFKNLSRTYRLVPAVRFVELASEPGTSRLLGRVLTEERIQAFGGELLGDSVLFGDVAFTVQPGYVGTTS